MALPSTSTVFDSAQVEDSRVATTEVTQVISSQPSIISKLNYSLLKCHQQVAFEAKSSQAMSFQASEQADLQYSNG